MADLVVTAANVAPASDAVIIYGIAGATITAGQVLYQDANGKYQPCVGNNLALSKAVGIALNNAALNQTVGVQKGGGINPGATVAIGTPYVASVNAGGIAPVGDLTTGTYSTFLGFGTTATNIQMPVAGPFQSGVAHA